MNKKNNLQKEIIENNAYKRMINNIVHLAPDLEAPSEQHSWFGVTNYPQENGLPVIK